MTPKSFRIQAASVLERGRRIGLKSSLRKFFDLKSSKAGKDDLHSCGLHIFMAKRLYAYALYTCRIYSFPHCSDCILGHDHFRLVMEVNSYDRNVHV